MAKGRKKRRWLTLGSKLVSEQRLRDPDAISEILCEIMEREELDPEIRAVRRRVPRADEHYIR